MLLIALTAVAASEIQKVQAFKLETKLIFFFFEVC